MKLENKYIPEPNTGCWIWFGWSDMEGYGRVSADGKVIRAHRLMYEKHVGEIPEGKIVCHRCNNKWCVNPEHLYAGTLSDNLNDSYRQGRVKPKNHRIPASIVRNVRADKSAGMASNDIAAKYGISRSSVNKFYNRTTRYEVR